MLTTLKSTFSVCLLSVVLLLPYFARGHASVLVGGVGLGYSCLVLPMVISANYKYPVSVLRSFAIKVKGNIKHNYFNYKLLMIINVPCT